MSGFCHKEAHAKLMKAFNYAFIEAQKRGVDLKKLQWHGDIEGVKQYKKVAA